MTASPPTPQPHAIARVDAYDLMRGVGAFAVICIHAFPILLQGVAKNSGAWTLAVVLNTLLLFAVPAFLLITSLLVTRSFLRQPSVGAAWRRRLTSTLWPYALWTTLFLGLAWRSHKNFRWGDAAFRVLTGKSYDHLYFLGIILQLYLVLPLLLPWFQKRPPARVMLSALVAVTLLVYAANRYAVHYPYVGSVFLWQTPSIMLGLWLGCRYEQAESIFQKWTTAALGLALPAFCFYALLTNDVMNGRHVNTFYYQVSEWTYTTCMALFGLCLCFRLPAHFAGRQTLLYWGRNSLALYLLHYLPCILLPRLLYRYHIPALPLFVLDVIVSLAVPLVIIRLIHGTKLAVFLLGRN